MEFDCNKIARTIASIKSLSYTLKWYTHCDVLIVMLYSWGHCTHCDVVHKALVMSQYRVNCYVIMVADITELYKCGTTLVTSTVMSLFMVYYNVLVL